MDDNGGVASFLRAVALLIAVPIAGIGIGAALTHWQDWPKCEPSSNNRATAAEVHRLAEQLQILNEQILRVREDCAEKAKVP
jgi:hypothetical protein